MNWITGKLWKISIAYLIIILILWLVLVFAGDRWWPATLLLFGPRWIFALPLVFLAPLALLQQRKLLLPLGLAFVIVFWPLMGLKVSFPIGSKTANRAVRVLTCNTENGNAQQRAVDLAQTLSADIVALQEYRDDKPLKPPLGWQMIRQGELVVLSRFPLRELQTIKALHPPHKYPRFCALLAAVTTTDGVVGFCAVHLPSPRYGLQHVLDLHTGVRISKAGLLRNETAHRRQVAWDLQRLVTAVPLPVIVAGDFNMPAESSIYRENLAGYTNAFSATGFGYGYTVQSHLRGVRLSARIDHILTNDRIKPLSCKVGPDIGSDHLPVIGDFVIVGSRH